MLYRHRLVSASFILNAEVIEVWWQLADAHRFRLFFYFAQQFSSLFKNGNVCRKIFSHIVKHFQYVKNPLYEKMSLRPVGRLMATWDDKKKLSHDIYASFLVKRCLSVLLRYIKHNLVLAKHQNGAIKRLSTHPFFFHSTHCVFEHGKSVWYTRQ